MGFPSPSTREKPVVAWRLSIGADHSLTPFLGYFSVKILVFVLSVALFLSFVFLLIVFHLGLGLLPMCRGSEVILSTWRHLLNFEGIFPILGGTSYMAAHPMSVHERVIEQQRATF